MKVYLIGSLAFRRKIKKELKIIYNILRNKKLTVFTVNIDDPELQRVYKLNKKNHKKIYIQTQKKILNSDFAVVEASYPSISVGGLITTFLNLHKNVLVLYKTKPHCLLTGSSNRLLTVKKYNNNDSLEKIITSFIKQVRKRHLSKRFNFLIDQELAEYINQKAHSKKMSQGEYIRKLIQEDMYKDTNNPL